MSGWTTPVMILMSVDLPAPFSPSRAWISPGMSASETSSSAWISPNRLETPRISITGLLIADASERSPTLASPCSNMRGSVTIRKQT